MASGAVGTLARHDVRRRWRAIVATGLLAGLVAGIGLACLAGARRTDTLFDRHLAATRASDVEIDPGAPTPEADAALRALPGVTDTSYWVQVGAFFLDEDGAFDPDLAGMIALTTDGRYLDQDRVAVRAGRLLDRDRPDEVMLNQYLAEGIEERTGKQIRIGTELDLGLAPISEEGAPAAEAPEQVQRVTVVGIMALPEDVVGSELDQVPKLFVSPALQPPGGYDAHPEYLGYAWYGLRMADGEAGVDAVVARWQQLTEEHNAATGDGPGGWLNFVRRTSDLRRTASRAIQPMVAALSTFGLLALAGAVILLAQALARLVRQGLDDIRVAQVLGLTTGEAARAALLVPALVVAVAAAVATVTAVALSSRFPAGPYRILEPSPGIDVDLLVLLGGLVVITVVALGTAAVVARRQAHLGLLDQRVAIARPSALVARLARLGAPPPLLSAVRLTVEPGRGRAFVPTRLVLVSSIVTVGLLATTLVFGSNLSALAGQPERFGWTGDTLVMTGGGYSRIDPDRYVPWLDGRTDLSGWRVVGADRIVVNGRDTPGALFGPSGGDDGDVLQPVLVEGRAPNRKGEVVLGRRTLRELGVSVGDRVTLGDGDAERSAVVTGAAVFPELGPVLAVRTRLDDGIWTHPDDAASYATLGFEDWGPPYNMLLLDLAPGASRAALAKDMESLLTPEDLQYGVTIDHYGVVRPAEVSTAASASRAQSALVGAVSVVAVLSLLLTLVAVVRRRRRDLAILAVLGFTPRQLRATVLMQGVIFALVGVVLGIPLGLVAGRLLWRRFADNLGVVPDPSVPWTALAVAAVAVVAAGALSSVAPALGAGRASTANPDRAQA